MAKCPNCHRQTARTKEWACEWCGYPLVSGRYVKTPKASAEPRQETQPGLAGLAPQLQPGPAREPESKLGPSTSATVPAMPREVAFGAMRAKLPFLLYLVNFAGAEVMTHFVSELGGIILYFCLLGGLIINSAVDGKEARRGLWLALGLVPVMRIVSLAVPVEEISEIYWYIIIAVPVFAGALAVVRTLGYRPGDVGLTRGSIPLHALLAVGGFGYGMLDYLILRPESLVQELTLREALVPALILLVATGFVEELVFRGVIQRAAQAIGSLGWVYVAVLYSLLQVGHGSVGHVLFAFVAVLFLGWVVRQTGSIMGVALFHGLLNVSLFLVSPHLL